jgi:hypothetical protein
MKTLIFGARFFYVPESPVTISWGKAFLETDVKPQTSVRAFDGQKSIERKFSCEIRRGAQAS